MAGSVPGQVERSFAKVLEVAFRARGRDASPWEISKDVKGKEGKLPIPL